MVAAPVKVVFNYFLSVALGQTAALVWTIVLRDDWHKGSGGLLVVSFLTSVAIGMALELGQLLLNHVCCKCCPCHDDEAISDAPAGQRADVVVAQPAA